MGATLRAPTLEELAGDPHPHLARLRAVAPVAFVPALGGYLVTGRAAALDVLRDPAAFTVDDPRFSTGRVVGPSMLSLDGAEHQRHRTPFVAPFRPRQVGARFGTFVAAQADRRVEAVAATPSRTAELRTSLAGPLAAAVVADSLGLDADDEAIVQQLLGWYREIVTSVSGAAAGRAVTAPGTESMAALASALRAHLDAGAESLLADAVNAGSLDRAEAVSNAAVIMFGGIETTEAMILNALWFVLGDHGGWTPATHDPAGVGQAVEESLRLEPAAAVVDRYATRDVTLAGTEIPTGALVVVSLAGANRDPAEFPDPDRFDPSRPNVRRQLAFASGPHVCLGMDLARLETCVAVAALLRRLPALRMANGSPPPTGLVFRKPERLDVTWDAPEEATRGGRA